MEKRLFIHKLKDALSNGLSVAGGVNPYAFEANPPKKDLQKPTILWFPRQRQIKIER